MISVLVIEDKEFIRNSYVDALREAGFDVDMAATRAEALEKVRNRTYGVALVDIMLTDDDSDRSGIEILQMLQDYKEGTRSVVVTAKDDMDVAINSYQAGVVGVLRKHRIVSTKEIVEVVERAAEGVQLALFGRYANLLALLAEPELVPYWETTVLSALKADYYSLTDALKRAFTPFLPVLRLTDQRESLKVDHAAGTAHGVFWSKKTGQPIWVALAGKGAKLTVPPEGHAGRVLFERDKGTVKVSVWELTGYNRDLFRETLWDKP